MQLVEIKNVHGLIATKPFFDQPVKNKQKAYENVVYISRSNDYTTWNLLDYLYHKNIKILEQIYQDIQLQVFLNKLML